MQRVSIRFYAELNDFLPPARRMRTTELHFHVPGSVKDLIESCGVPHTEVDLVLVNGRSVGFEHRLADGDRVSVYPVFESLDITPLLKVRPKPLRTPRFVVDTHLGRLAAYLRMLGFDTLYNKGAGDAELARASSEEGRVLLTRDRGLLKRGTITHGCYIREPNPRRQAIEVLRRLDLAGTAKPFSRCLACNGLLADASGSDVTARLPAGVRGRYREFQVCAACGRVFWKGSHYRRMEQLVQELLREAGGVR